MTNIGRVLVSIFTVGAAALLVAFVLKVLAVF